jgi:5-methylcytosine-specific restriction endonuclease McrA
MFGVRLFPLVGKRKEWDMVRQDKQGPHRVAYEKNKKVIFKTQNVCGICGKQVDFSIKAPEPLSPVVDHIIPVSKGGHPSAMENLQLAHWTCNRQKSDKMFLTMQEAPQVLGNRNLPQSTNWATYKG